jgi:hypothetical protein
MLCADFQAISGNFFSDCCPFLSSDGGPGRLREKPGKLGCSCSTLFTIFDYHNSIFSALEESGAFAYDKRKEKRNRQRRK